MFVLDHTGISSVQNSDRLATWDEVSILRDAAEAAFRAFFEKMIDDRHVLESRIRILERQLREMRGELGRKREMGQL